MKIIGKNVPSFFPTLKAYKVDGLKQPEYILSKGLRSEKRSLQAFGFVAVQLFFMVFGSFEVEKV